MSALFRCRPSHTRFLWRTSRMHSTIWISQSNLHKVRRSYIGPQQIQSMGTRTSFPPAVPQLRQEIAITPQPPIGELYLQAEFLEKRGDMQGALQLYDQILKQDPGFTPALIQMSL